MNMIRSAKNQIAELTAAAYRAAVQEGLLPEGVQTIPAVVLSILVWQQAYCRIRGFRCPSSVMV